MNDTENNNQQVPIDLEPVRSLVASLPQFGNKLDIATRGLGNLTLQLDAATLAMNRRMVMDSKNLEATAKSPSGVGVPKMEPTAEDKKRITATLSNSVDVIFGRDSAFTKLTEKFGKSSAFAKMLNNFEPPDIAKLTKASKKNIAAIDAMMKDVDGVVGKNSMLSNLVEKFSKNSVFSKLVDGIEVPEEPGVDADNTKEATFTEDVAPTEVIITGISPEGGLVLEKLLDKAREKEKTKEKNGTNSDDKKTPGFLNGILDKFGLDLMAKATPVLLNVVSKALPILAVAAAAWALGKYLEDKPEKLRKALLGDVDPYEEQRSPIGAWLHRILPMSAEDKGVLDAREYNRQHDPNFNADGALVDANKDKTKRVRPASNTKLEEEPEETEEQFQKRIHPEGVPDVTPDVRTEPNTSLAPAESPKKTDIAEETAGYGAPETAVGAEAEMEAELDRAQAEENQAIAGKAAGAAVASSNENIGKIVATQEKTNNLVVAAIQKLSDKPGSVIANVGGGGNSGGAPSYVNPRSSSSYDAAFDLRSRYWALYTKGL